MRSFNRYLDEIYKFDDTRFSSHPILLDLGFCEGQFAIPFLQRYGGSMHGYEACFETMQRGNLKLVEAGFSVTSRLINCAVTSHGKRTPFYGSDKPLSSSVYAEDARGLCKKKLINSMTLQHILTSNILREVSIDLLKMNIEGAEWTALPTTPVIAFQHVQQMVIELHPESAAVTDLDTQFAEITNHLRHGGFQVQVAPKDAPSDCLRLWVHR